MDGWADENHAITLSAVELKKLGHMMKLLINNVQWNLMKFWQKLKEIISKSWSLKRDWEKEIGPIS